MILAKITENWCRFTTCTKSLIILCILLAWTTFTSHVTNYISTYYCLNISKSLPGTIYRYTDNAIKLKKGDIVLVCPLTEQLNIMTKYLPKSTNCGNGLIPLMKVVGAVPNDTVIADGKLELQVNGRILRNTKPTQKIEYESIPRFKYKGKVPKNWYLVYTNSVDGFDSRYFGFVRKESILRKVERLF